jgi:hypothetical protein
LNPLTALLQALELQGVGLDVEVVRDAVWLASHLAEREPPVTAAAFPAEPQSANRVPLAPDDRVQTPAPPLEARRREPPPAASAAIADRAPAPASGGGVPAFSRVRLPRAAGLVGERGIAGALRPLRRKIRSARAPIDEVATVRHALEDDLWLPVYNTVADRWLELALVVDRSVSMTVWQEVVRELRRVFVRAAAFRDVRVWRLSTEDEDVGVELVSARSSPRKRSLDVRSPFGGGRRGLVLVISDFVSAGWYDGRVLGLLHDWSRESPVALLQVLPERLWSRTALAEGVRVELRAVATAMTNPHLHWAAELPLPEAGWRSRGMGVASTLALFPIVTADPASLRRLARMVAGSNDESLNGVLFDLTADIPLPVTRDVTPDERVRRFWSLSSSAAGELASLLSAAPVTSTGILRLLRKELLPAADPSVEAEVLFSGLLSVPKDTPITDDLALEFLEGVRQVLLENAPVDRVLEALRQVAAHAAIPGISSPTFESWILDPSSAAENLAPGDDPMAAQIAAVLEQIGGDYARIVHPGARRGPAIGRQAAGTVATDTSAETSAAASTDTDEPADRPVEAPARTFRIFVGSSSSASVEAASMREIVDRINAGAESALTSRYELELWQDMAFASGETNERLGARFASADVFVGILSGELGGVQQEFEAVVEQFKRTGKPRIRFYIDNAPAAGAGRGAAVTRRNEFQQFLLRTDTSFRLYDDAAAFRDRVEHDLSRLLADLDAEGASTGPAPSRTCFVVMGFGEKTDLPTGRVIDLDESYQMIKAAVEDVGLRCIRADEVVHAGLIDRVVFEFVFEADVVIADLSTANANAIYQLGVRLALRPAVTIVIAEKQFTFPSDLGHVVLRQYEHRGKGIAAKEQTRMRGELSEVLRSAVTRRQMDSPVYAFLPSLQPAAMGANRADAPPIVPRLPDTRKPRCFVVMGFGRKTDFATMRTLNLDASYRVIKRAVEQAGLECVRADEIIHSGVIDSPIYDHLLTADIVIADLSTSNANALFELGIRHGLRPSGTIVIAEEQFQFPFDINHMPLFRYRHLGSAIDAEEAERMQAQLRELITIRMSRPEVDSPVYTFLPALQPPSLPAAAEPREGSGVEEFTEAMDAAMKSAKWADAIAIGQRLVLLVPSDPSPRQQLALATYKSEQPDAASALMAAKSILVELEPLQSGDPQTLALWAAVHKRQWELSGDRAALDEAIAALDLAFKLDSDYSNGINLAFLLITRASLLPFEAGRADRGQAERTYRQVIAMCDGLIRTSEIGPEGGSADPVQMFWIRAALVEAFVGAGETTQANELETGVIDSAPEPWMAESFKEQVRKVREILSRSRAS